MDAVWSQPKLSSSSIDHGFFSYAPDQHLNAEVTATEIVSIDSIQLLLHTTATRTITSSKSRNKSNQFTKPKHFPVMYVPTLGTKQIH